VYSGQMEAFRESTAPVWAFTENTRTKHSSFVNETILNHLFAKHYIIRTPCSNIKV